MTLYKLQTQIKGAYLAAVKLAEVKNEEKGSIAFINFSFSSNGELFNAWAYGSDFTELPATDTKYDIVVSVSSKIGNYNKEVSYLSVRVVSLTPAK